MRMQNAWSNWYDYKSIMLHIIVYTRAIDILIVQ